MNVRTISLSSCVFVFFALLFIQGCMQDSNPKPQFQTEYQAVILANAPSIYGKAEFIGTEYVLLKDVYYIRSQVNQETKQVTNTLIKKGQEWHGAQQMYINTRHIVMIEPVAPESQVAKFIQESKSRKPELPKP